MSINGPVAKILGPSQKAPTLTKEFACLVGFVQITCLAQMSKNNIYTDKQRWEIRNGRGLGLCYNMVQKFKSHKCDEKHKGLHWTHKKKEANKNIYYV